MSPAEVNDAWVRDTLKRAAAPTPSAYPAVVPPPPPARVFDDSRVTPGAQGLLVDDGVGADVGVDDGVGVGVEVDDGVGAASKQSPVGEWTSAPEDATNETAWRESAESQGATVTKAFTVAGPTTVRHQR